MSCRQRPEYRRLTSSATRQVEEFEVATGGGSWVAAGALNCLRHLQVTETMRLLVGVRQTYRQIYRNKNPLGGDRRR